MDFILYYTAPDLTRGSVSFAIGDTYETAEEFVEEFKWDHPNLIVTNVEEE